MTYFLKFHSFGGPTTQRQRASVLVPLHSNNNCLSMREFRKKAPVSLAFSPVSNRIEDVETFMTDDDLLHCMDSLSADEMVRFFFTICYSADFWN